MQISDHEPLIQNAFRGIYSRGEYDSVPKGFFLDGLNNKFSEDKVGTRDGTVLNISTTRIVRAFTYKRLNETNRFIWLDSDGKLYDSLFGGAPIYSDASFVDFSMVNYNNRAYITAHNRVTGIASKKLLVYEGGGTARLAAGSAPSGFTLLTSPSASSGSVESGYHIFAVAYVTTSGFITAPGPAVFTLYSTPELATSGGVPVPPSTPKFKVDVSAIPVGPAGTVGRYILATKAIPPSLYNGDLQGYELFFVPNGFVNDNSSTTLTVDFFDADLQESADYLIDNLGQIPAGLGIGVYSGRLITWGENGNEFTVRCSKANEPESFNSVSGFINVDPSDSESGVRNAFEHRKSLVICTSNRLYQTSDNNSDPSTWEIDSIDKSNGTECFGIATVLDARGVNSDRVWIASRAGLLNFEGYIRKPELSYNIQNLWGRINKAKFNLIQVVDDPYKHRLLVSVPLDSATSISHILVGDYTEAFTVYNTIDEKQIKWDVWTFPHSVLSIIGDVDNTTRSAVYHFALSNGTIVTMKEGLLDDYSNAIPTPFFVTDLKYKVPGYIHHFGGLKIRATGNGTLTTKFYALDKYPEAKNSFTDGGVGGPSFTMTDNPSLEPDSLINFINERMAIKFGMSLFQERYSFSRIDTWIRPVWLRRPTA